MPVYRKHPDERWIVQTMMGGGEMRFEKNADCIYDPEYGMYVYAIEDPLHQVRFISRQSISHLSADWPNGLPDQVPESTLLRLFQRADGRDWRGGIAAARRQLRRASEQDEE